MEFDRVVCDSTKRITGAYNPPSHKGVDIGWRTDEEQNKVYANCWGTVIKTLDGLNNGDNTGGGWGNYVLIKHPNGMCSRYAHLQKGLKVSVGTEVDESSVLGIMGDSGIAYGRHLHFEVQNNESADSRIDPTPYLRTPIWSKSSEPPKPEPTPEPEIVKGTKVRVIGDGYGTSYGESPMCKYRYEGYIGLDPILDRPYPYCVYDDEGAVAWYKREDLEII